VVARALFDVPVLSGGAYRGMRRSVVLEFKEASQRRLANALITPRLVAGLVSHLPIRGSVVIVPVPSSVAGRWRRGYSPTAHVATALQGHLPGTALVQGLRLSVAATLSETVLRQVPYGRSRAERLGRSASPWRVRLLPPHSIVVLVDDVMVTGGTLEAAAGALQAHGHLVCAAVVLAHVPSAVNPSISSLGKPDYSGSATLTRRT